MNFPNPISGASKMALWLNRLLEACKGTRLLPGPGYKIKQTPNGIILEFDRRPRRNVER